MLEILEENEENGGHHMIFATFELEIVGGGFKTAELVTQLCYLTVDGQLGDVAM